MSRASDAALEPFADIGAFRLEWLRCFMMKQKILRFRFAAEVKIPQSITSRGSLLNPRLTESFENDC